MSDIELSVVLCVHNPRESVVARVLVALARQTLALERWELLLVDNASDPPLTERGWAVPDNTRWVSEPVPGLTQARLAGFGAASGNVLVLIDDDTLPAHDYLANALSLLRQHPEIGAAGGCIHGEFTSSPPPWADGYLDCLALRDFGERPIRALIDNQAGPWEPCGAGMVLRADVARAYVRRLDDSRRRSLDRVGNALSSCGDSDLARTAPELGLYLAYEPSLRLTHVIPSSRLRLGYLACLVYSIQRDGWLLYRLRGRACQIEGWRRWARLLLLPLSSFDPDPRRWLLRAASLFGQIRGRSLPLSR